MTTAYDAWRTSAPDRDAPFELMDLNADIDRAAELLSAVVGNAADVSITLPSWFADRWRPGEPSYLDVTFEHVELAPGESAATALAELFELAAKGLRERGA